ncbi:hypothetical protein TSOC_000703 [Tetrabaena socialis]|uniref:Uncharacterized protein n=1 Tax=Tetrabaena socialis TaxID=47790 RepID=A0A2J8AIQ5_9CHLO|nr:hypothetical protein TSOC_000703 [Tetrabaena socialis]|eukprot:PNH12397.1 hypothetical protein TSOC_000703 [Tetrabaena socialis]
MSKAKRLQLHGRRNKARLEDGLLSVIPVLWPLLGAEDRRSLRACCCATRERADWLLDALSSKRSVPPSIYSPPATLLAAAWRRALTRGARPCKLELRLRGLQSSACEGFGLRVLAELGAASPPVILTDVSLLGVPLTAAVVRGIAAAAPRLSVLHLSGYDLSLCTGLRGSLPFSNGLSGAQGLLRHAAPHLKDLSLEGLGTWAVAPWLPLLLQQCSRLASLSLGVWAPSDALIEALPRLSQLTELSLDTFSDPVLPAVAQLRGLVKLDLKFCTLKPGSLQLLAGLTALKELDLETVVLPRSLDPAELLQPNTLPLPPLLESLTISGGIHPAALAALRLPESLTDLSVYGTLYDAVWQAAIRRLDLRFVELGAADVAALVRQLPALEALFLMCHAPPYTWPLLRRLARLRVLRLYPGMGSSVMHWKEFGNEQALRAALLTLCMEAAALERLELAPLSQGRDNVNTSAFAVRGRANCKAAVSWLEEALPRLCASPPKIVCDVWEDECSRWDAIAYC